MIVQINTDYKLRTSSSQYVFDAYGNKLFTKYYPGNWPNVGIMLFHGMGEDQNSLKMYTRYLNAVGFHVFTTDFSGHGRSNGVTPNGENSDDILANQVLRAKAAFKYLSGLSDSDIFLLGHSMGSRAVMKATQIDTNHVNGCILIGSAIDVDNVSNDSWVNDLGLNNPQCNIYILTGTWDDVQSPNDALKLFQTLTENDTLTDLNSDYLTPDGMTISLKVLRALTHTHESMSFRVSVWIDYWINKILTKDDIHIEPTEGNNQNAIRFNPYSFIVWQNLIEIIGIYLLLIYGQKIIKIEQEKRIEIRKNNTSQEKFELKRFFWFKPLIWLGALIIAIIVGVILLFLPISIPFFTLLFICPILGYGILNTILYASGKMPGFNGKLKPKLKGFFEEINWWNILFGIAVTVIIIAVLSYMINGFLYHVFPLNIRLVWLVIFTIFGTLGFYIYQFEILELRKAYPNKLEITILNNFLFLVPFSIGALAILFSGWIIFFVDAVNDLILLGLVILVGNLLYQIWKKPIFTAFMQSFLLFFLLVPRGQMALNFY